MFPNLEFIKTCLNGLRSRIEKVEAQTADIQELKAQVEEIRGTSAAPKDPYIVYSTDKSGAITVALYNFESIPDYLFNNEAQIAKADFSGSPNLISIGNYAFYGCTSLTSIDLPEGVTSISVHAFSGCTSMTSITISDGVTSIGDYAFYYCNSLTSITIPEGVTSIDVSVFRNCTSLTSIDLPESVTSIGVSAFYGCSKLTALILRNEETVCTLSSTSAFTGTPIGPGSAGYIYVPAALVGSYKAGTNWATYANQIRAIEDYPEITGG